MKFPELDQTIFEDAAMFLERLGYPGTAQSLLKYASYLQGELSEAYSVCDDLRGDCDDVELERDRLAAENARLREYLTPIQLDHFENQSD